MPPDHLAPLSAYAGWSARTLYQTLSAERMLPKTTQTTAVGIHSAKFSCHSASAPFFPSHEMDIYAVVPTLMTRSCLLSFCSFVS